jgi:putative endonuclease
MHNTTRSIGTEGEQQAKHFLIRNNFIIREQQWRCSLGELDLIVEKNNILVFVEVKTRSSDAFGSAAEAIIKKKQRKIAQVAAAYIKIKRLFDKDYRFDVIGVTPEGIEHIENAFFVEGFTV